jgi:hypothetical protein
MRIVDVLQKDGSIREVLLWQSVIAPVSDGTRLPPTVISWLHPWQVTRTTAEIRIKKQALGATLPTLGSGTSSVKYQCVVSTVWCEFCEVPMCGEYCLVWILWSTNVWWVLFGVNSVKYQCVVSTVWCEFCEVQCVVSTVWCEFCDVSSQYCLLGVLLGSICFVTVCWKFLDVQYVVSTVCGVHFSENCLWRTMCGECPRVHLWIEGWVNLVRPKAEHSSSYFNTNEMS